MRYRSDPISVQKHQSQPAWLAKNDEAGAHLINIYTVCSVSIAHNVEYERVNAHRSLYARQHDAHAIV